MTCAQNPRAFLKSNALRRFRRACLVSVWVGGLAASGCGPGPDRGAAIPDQPRSEAPSGQAQDKDGGVQQPPAKPADPCVAAVQASADDGNGPLNALDGNLFTRWSAEGDGVWLRYDFGTPSLIAAVDLAWYLGDTRVARFSLQVSEDALHWQPLLQGQSGGSSTTPERHAFAEVTTRYVRLVGHGNDLNAWTSLSEMKFHGSAEAPLVSAPTPSVWCDDATPSVDAGADLDGGTPSDAGTPPDAGDEIDGGSGADAGTLPPTGGTADQLLGTFDTMTAGGFGSLSAAELESHFGRSADKAYSLSHLEVVADGAGKYLRQRYVPNSIGSPRVGWQFPVKGGTEVWASYRLYFEPGWEWVKGGKLPGLAGGTAPTGGDFDDNGFSARMMWRSGGRLVLYAYHHDRPTKYGEDFVLKEADGKDWVAPIGQWFTIRQRLKMNSSGSAWDGEAEVWIDGKQKLLKKGLRWRKSTSYSADRFLYSSFYGGNDSTWAPSKTTYARFDTFKVASTAAGVD